MDRREQIIDDAVRSFRARLVEAIGEMEEARTPGAFCGAERTVMGLARELGGEITRRVLQDVSDDTSRRKAALAKCRDKARPRGIELRVERRRKTLVRTLSGSLVEVTTPYASARPRGGGRLNTRGRQGTGVYPVLDELGILGRSTPALRLLVSRAVCEANSVSSARELLEDSGLSVDHKAALRLTYLVADDALREREAGIRRTSEGVDGGAFAGRKVVVTVDGGRINIRRRVAGRPKKGGRKRFVTEWREPKILTLYDMGEDGKRDKKVAPIIDGTLGDADAVYALIRYHLLRVGGHQAAEVALVGDGAVWIWNRGERLREEMGLPPERFHEILDYFHAAERLYDFASGQAGWSEPGRKTWIRVQKERLKAGRIEEIEDVLRGISNSSAEDLSTELKYWSRNRERLRFAAYRERGLPNGSGVVESSVRRVVNLRLKGASTVWTEEHAEGVLHLRAHAKSGRWKELEDAVLANTGWRPTSRQVTGAA
jgi:hypothetical protein